MMKPKQLAGLIALAVCAVPARADADQAGDRHRQHDAHLHGLAELTLAMEGNQLELALESPSANIVGFEHRATSDSQMRAVSAARDRLNDAMSLFSFVGTSCELEEASIDVSAVTQGADRDHHEDDHHDDDHHDDDHHDDEDHHGASHDGEETHSDVSASYRFTCSNGQRLKALAVDLLEHFPGIETLNARWVTDAGQGAAALTATARVIRLK